MTFACGRAKPVFDAALASFAAHHLTSSDEKRRFLTGVRQHLGPGATLYVVDVFRRDGVRTPDQTTSVSFGNGGKRRAMEANAG